MAEMFLFNIAETILQELGGLVRQEIGLVLGVENELKELENTLSTIKAVLLDAEEQEQQATNHEQLHDWLRKLKAAFTDADDLLDEIEFENLQQQQLVHHRFTRKVREFIRFPHSLKFRLKMGHKLKGFNKRLDKIAADKTKFHLTERLGDNRPGFVRRDQREMTHSFIRGVDVIGRNYDRENIIEMLMSSSDYHEHVSVISIVGIGGLGKTTLAKFVYNDEKVVEHFQLKIWVCVSSDFDLEILMRKIIASANSGVCVGVGIESLQSRLRKTVSGKKFLLILDDVWKADHRKWSELINLLMEGGRGSKIIVTTRSNSVASFMGGSGTHSYNLGGLEGKHCLSLFVKWAFPKGEERNHPHLLKIGEEIVNKCKGVPLAARTLGCLLYKKTNERDWLRVKDSEIWKLKDQKEDDILPALRLSYDQLPYYLKQCFAFCSNFQRGQCIYKDQLIRLWMAQGLIRSSGQNQDQLEDVGDQYFDELCSRSFFQEVQENGPLYVTFTMHDLVYDLAQSVAQTECITMNSHTGDISNLVRHVSFVGCDYLSGKEVPTCIRKLEKLRTIFFPHDGIHSIHDSFVDECISKFLLLRVIDIADSYFEVLPPSIGYLQHLKYLDISRNDRIKNLPESICKLLILQTMQFSDCKDLQQLPKDVGNLRKLRHLHITTQEKFFQEKGIGCLTSLRSLWISGCVNLVSLPEEIQHLTVLQTLVINRCPKLASLPSCIANLTKLENLMINDCEELKFVKAIGIQYLSIRTLVFGELPKLVVLPQWLYGVARSIQCLRIACCSNLMELPEWLNNSTSLQKLEILECPKLSVLPKGFHQLNALKILRIVECHELIRSCQPETGEDWKMIAHIPEIYLNKTKITTTTTHY